MVLSSRLYSRTQLMRAPLARSLLKIVEGPFQDIGPKVFALASIFPFFLAACLLSNPFIHHIYS